MPRRILRRRKLNIFVHLQNALKRVEHPGVLYFAATRPATFSPAAHSYCSESRHPEIGCGTYNQAEADEGRLHCPPRL
jgi:hypothetical protein